MVRLGAVVRYRYRSPSVKGDWSLAVPLISAISTTIIAFAALFMGRAVWTR